MKKVILILLILVCTGCFNKNNDLIDFDGKSIKTDSSYETEINGIKNNIVESNLMISNSVKFNKVVFDYLVDGNIKNISFESIDSDGSVTVSNNEVTYKNNKLLGRDASNKGGYTPFVTVHIELVNPDENVRLYINNATAYNNVTPKKLGDCFFDYTN